MKKKIINYVKKKINKYNVVLNINKDLTRKQKKVVVIYIHNNFISKYKEVYHSQIYEMTQIIKLFIDRDYAIDVINVNEDNAWELIKEQKYDIVFGLGELFYKIALRNINAKKILYLTENHPIFSYKKEKERVNYYTERTHRKAKLTRTNVYFKTEYFDISDYVISMGNEDDLKERGIKSLSISPTGLINVNYKYKDIDDISKRNNFLWFGSSGAIHKGLDIIYEVFNSRSDIYLYICGLNKKEQRKLKIRPKKNIKILGIVDVNSDEFLELCNKCVWILYPSCSEAMSTAVLTCMLHSLIPVVIKENGFAKLKDNAMFLEDFHIEYIDKYINMLINMEIKDINKMKRKVYDYSRKEFIIERYNENLNKIFNQLRI